ncbi:MAG: phosphonate C-P lyase system protein PhnG [Pseudomonadota bacterium]
MDETDARLNVLARANAARLKKFAESLIGHLGQIEVLHSRTGLVMVPMRDTAQGTNFHLGEVLVSEAHIQSDHHQGYGMRRGHDLEASMAMALVDLALQRGIASDNCSAFIAEEAAAIEHADVETLKRVEATRVDMETF